MERRGHCFAKWRGQDFSFDGEEGALFREVEGGRIFLLIETRGR